MEKPANTEKAGSKAIKVIKTVLLIFVILCFSLFFLLVSLHYETGRVIFDTEAAAGIDYSPPEKIVPGPGLPAQVKPLKSNNNVDIASYKGRFYMAFRTAPTHFAASNTKLYVVSSADAKKWDFETTFNLGGDLREPRFLVFKDKLFLYFFKGGVNPLSFAPEHIYALEFAAPAKWSEPKPIYEPGYVIWRAKEHDGKAYMSVYYGVGLYSNETEPGHLRLLVSDDGYNYRMVNNREVSSEVSAEEGEFEFDEEGNLYATIRLEMKGGKVCFARKTALTEWDCRFTPYKYDSALMFRHGGDFYVIARRNVAGPYNTGSKILPRSLRSKWYLAKYSLTRKRTALYKLDKEKMELVPLFDFPSIGDTAYAGIVPVSDDKYLVVNYSCDINGFDWNWLGGQVFGGTNIYAFTLDFK